MKMEKSAVENLAYTRFSQPTETIVYEAVEMGEGWQVAVVLPPKTSASDRIRVLNWMEDYRTSIRRQYPLWLTALHTNPRQVCLNITPVSGVRELVSKGPAINMKRNLGYLPTANE